MGWWWCRFQRIAELVEVSPFLQIAARRRSHGNRERFVGAASRRDSLFCLIQETQGVVIAERYFTPVLALVILWIHID